jgi:hypothetical protein
MPDLSTHIEDIPERRTTNTLLAIDEDIRPDDHRYLVLVNRHKGNVPGKTRYKV